MKTYFLRLLILSFLFGIAKLNASETSPQFIRGSDTLIVYKDVPGLTPSDKFTIRVRSAATNNEWVDVFAHYTYNRALEIPDINMVSGSSAGTNSSTSVQHYPNATAGWSQTYGNIEMSRNQPVEVEIAAKIGFQIGGQDFFKATVHPEQKASIATVTNGKVYFTISNPAQVVIDINGQMDDYNAFVNPIGIPTDGVSKYTVPLHTITMFTNPVMKKPSLNGVRVKYIEPGTDSTAMRVITNQTTSTTYDTLYFKPGVHNIGMGQKIYPGKAVYIPGDAIVYGSLNNWNVPFVGFSKIGERIKIFGYGTISGAKQSHPYYVLNPVDINHKTIAIDNPLNYQIIGVTVADPANFSVYTPSGVGGFLSYVKVIGWRANGDGLGNGDNVNDCFVRANDDCSYVRGNRKRVTYWKDNISAIFYMSQIWETTPILIEDCDVLYCRSRGGGGAAWDMRADAPSGQRPAQVTFRNIRFHDPLSNMTIFNLITYKGTAAAPTQVGGNYDWIKFENISILSSSVKSNLLGCAAAPWNGGLTFENVTFAGTKLTQQNFTTYFNTNEFVKDLVFKSTDYYTITNNTIPNNGFVALNPAAPNYLANTTVKLTATPRPGFEFESWIGDASGSTNPINVEMNGNKTISANFKAVQTGISSSSISLNGHIAVYPNPATDKLFYKSTNMQVLKIEFIDLAGRIVYSADAQKLNESIDLTGIKAGFYLIKFHTDQSVYSKKVVIK